MNIKSNKVVTSILLGLFFWNNTFAAYALVGGSTINSMSGVDSVNHVDSTTTINTKNNVTTSTINWQTLNVGAGETLNVNFTKASQTLLNNVVSGMTTVAGQILSSGVGADSSRVIISNPNGILLDKGSYINTNALMLTTLGVTISGSSIKFSQNATTPSNAGIVIKGQIGSEAKPMNGGLAVASRGIVLDGADIFAGGDVTLVTAEGATFTAGTAGKSTLASTVASTVALPPATIKEGGVDTTLTDNLIIKSNSAIRSKNGKIYLTDLSNNNGALKIASSNLNSYGSVTLKAKNINSTGSTIKSTASSIAITATDKADLADTDITSDKSTITATATNNLKTGNVNAYGNVALTGIGVDAKDVKSTAGYVSLNAKTGDLKVANVDSYGNVALTGKDIKTLGSTIKSAIGSIAMTATNDIDASATNFETLKSTVAMTATNNLKAGNINSYGSVTLKGKDITAGSNIKSVAGNISATATNTADFSNTDIVNEKGTVGLAATNSLKAKNITSVGNVALSGIGVEAKDIKSTAGYVSLNAKTGDLKVANVDSYGNVALTGKNITTLGSTIKSAIGSIAMTATNDIDASATNFETLKSTVAMTATNNLKAGNINSYGSVTLKGKDITAGSNIKSVAGNISATATNTADFSNTDIVNEKGTVGVSATNSLKAKNITSVGNVALTGLGVDAKDVKSTAGYVSLNAKTGDLKVANIDSYGNVALTGRDISNSPANTLKSATGTITATASNNLKLYNLSGTQNMTLKGTNSAIIVGASTPKDIAISSTYKSNIFTHNVTANKVTLTGSTATPPADKNAKALIDAEKNRIETERLAKIEADRIEAERLAKIEADRIEADRLAQIEADRLAQIEAKIEAERLAKIEAERLAKIEADKRKKTASIEAQKTQVVARTVTDAPKPNLPNKNDQFKANIKSAAANEQSQPQVRNFQRTANGFNISQRIGIN